MDSPKRSKSRLLDAIKAEVRCATAWRYLASSKAIIRAADRRDATQGWTKGDTGDKALRTLRRPEGVAICRALARERLENGRESSLSQEQLKEASALDNVSTVEMVCRRLGTANGLGLIEDRQIWSMATREFAATDLLMQIIESKVLPEIEEALGSLSHGVETQP